MNLTPRRIHGEPFRGNRARDREDQAKRGDGGFGERRAGHASGGSFQKFTSGISHYAFTTRLPRNHRIFK